MDQQEQKLPQEQPRSERAVQFGQLRNKTIIEMRPAIEERRAKNPAPTEQELVIGAFVEEIEPQVRNAVFVLNDKGYTTGSSGFYGDTQGIDGFFKIDGETKEKLAVMGVTVDERENGYTWVKFSPDEPDLEAIKTQWDHIAEIVPSTGKPALLSQTYGSEMFREKYGNPTIVERLLLERGLAHGYPPPNDPERATVEARLTELKQIEQNIDASK